MDGGGGDGEADVPSEDARGQALPQGRPHSSRSGRVQPWPRGPGPIRVASISCVCRSFITSPACEESVCHGRSCPAVRCALGLRHGGTSLPWYPPAGGTATRRCVAVHRCRTRPPSSGWPCHPAIRRRQQVRGAGARCLPGQDRAYGRYRRLESQRHAPYHGDVWPSPESFSRGRCKCLACCCASRVARPRAVAWPCMVAWEASTATQRRVTVPPTLNTYRPVRPR